MLFWLGAGVAGGGAKGGAVDGGGAVVLAVVVAVVVLGVVVVEGLVDLFPPQPAVIAPSATTMTAPAITRVWRAVGDDVTIRSSLLPMIDRSAVPVQARMRRSRASPQLQSPIRAHGQRTPEATSQPLRNFGRALGAARINSCHLVGTGDANAGTSSVRA
jgi:hypothetical protein